MKKFLMVLSFSLCLFGAGVQAQTPKDCDNAFVPCTEDVFTIDSDGNSEILGVGTDLRDYSGDDPSLKIAGGSADSVHSGAYRIRNIAEKVINFIEIMIVPIAILLLIRGGITLLLARDNEELFQKRINQIIWMGAGFMLFVASFMIVDRMFFGYQGQLFDPNNAFGLEVLAGSALNEVHGIIRFISSFAVGIAVAFTVVSAIRLILFGESEEEQGRVRKQILYAVIGILVIALANTIASIFFSGGGPQGSGAISVNSSLFIAEIIYWTNILLGFVALGAVIAIIWAGIQMIIHFGNEETINKTKKIIMYAIIALVLAFSAYSIVRFFITPGIYADNDPSAASQLAPFDRGIVNP